MAYCLLLLLLIMMVIERNALLVTRIYSSEEM